MYKQTQKRIPVLTTTRKLSDDGSHIVVSHDTILMTANEAETHRKQEKERPLEGLPLLPIISF